MFFKPELKTKKFYYSTVQEIYILYQFCKLKYDVTYTEYSVMNTFGNFVNFCSLAFLGRYSVLS